MLTLKPWAYIRHYNSLERATVELKLAKIALKRPGWGRCMNVFKIINNKEREICELKMDFKKSFFELLAL